jgi:hypothetical protein
VSGSPIGDEKKLGVERCRVVARLGNFRQLASRRLRALVNIQP